MLFPPIDPNERFRERRATARRRKRLRRSAAVASFLFVISALGVGARFVGAGETQQPVADLATLATAPASGPRTLPIEMRGVHVTMALASLPGKLDEYLDLERDGLTALELDVKDENGEVGFQKPSVPLAVSSGAARDYYEAPEVARRVHRRGIYLVGRIVTFEDPVLSRARPDLAIRRTDGSAWRDAAGLGWTNPYDRRVWKYNVDLAEAAAKAGFDEIMFDYVRFPSDGDVGSTVYANKQSLAKRQATRTDEFEQRKAHAQPGAQQPQRQEPAAQDPPEKPTLDCFVAVQLTDQDHGCDTQRQRQPEAAGPPEPSARRRAMQRRKARCWSP